MKQSSILLLWQHLGGKKYDKLLLAIVFLLFLKEVNNKLQ